MGEKILVHCCCGPCSTLCLKRLIEEGWNPVLCYGNSNIWPQEENRKRWEELLKVARHYGLEVHRVEYDHEAWLEYIRGLEKEPEGGKRCERCFDFNFREARKEADKLGIKYFTTTLTVSRYKNSRKIFSVGNSYEGFEAIDFKKKDGYAQSIKLSREMGLYRQQYCGCEFSLDSAEEEDNAVCTADQVQ